MPTKRPEVQAAHWTVSNATRSGKLHKATNFLCFDCGEPAACYDHYLGYAPEHRLDVQPVCFSCHQKRGFRRGEYAHSTAFREMLRQRMLGNKIACGIERTEQHKKIIGDLRRGKPGPMLGKNFSIEHRRKIGQAHEGKIVSAETRARISLSKKGKVMSEESRANMGKSHIGFKHSPETIAKMSASRKAYHERKKAALVVN
jgi:NUMOD3 motif-containing protein